MLLIFDRVTSGYEITRDLTAWQAFPSSLLPYAREFPSPSISKACHAGYQKPYDLTTSLKNWLYVFSNVFPTISNSFSLIQLENYLAEAEGRGLRPSSDGYSKIYRLSDDVLKGFSRPSCAGIANKLTEKHYSTCVVTVEHLHNGHLGNRGKWPLWKGGSYWEVGV